MARRRRRCPWEFYDPQLERRELLSQAGVSPVTAQVVVQHVHIPRNLFHHDGIDGLTLHKSFENRMNTRFSISRDQARRVNQALQVFQSNYEQLPVNPQPGATGPTLDSLLQDLTREVLFAVSVREVLTNRPQPSVAKSIRISPLASNALMPFAQLQIEKLGATLAAQPPVVGPDGQLHRADPTAAVNAASNAILNALAETSVHPLLFLKPSDFYLSPDITFDTSFTDVPAQAAPGYFVRGPGGELLPGAIVHPHIAF